MPRSTPTFEPTTAAPGAPANAPGMSTNSAPCRSTTSFLFVPYIRPNSHAKFGRVIGLTLSVASNPLLVIRAAFFACAEKPLDGAIGARKITSSVSES